MNIKLTPLGGIPPKIQQNTTSRDKTRTAATGSFDRVDISSQTSSKDRFVSMLKSRLSEEIRVQESVSKAPQLKEQVESGNYSIDSDAIAKKILLGLE